MAYDVAIVVKDEYGARERMIDGTRTAAGIVVALGRLVQRRRMHRRIPEGYTLRYVASSWREVRDAKCYQECERRRDGRARGRSAARYPPTRWRWCP